MPNHVTTILKADPDVLAGIMRGYTEDEKAELLRDYEARVKRIRERGDDYNPPEPDLDGKIVDFELVVPSPPNKEVGGCSREHEAGVICWYSWNVENWGTKWGAYNMEVRDDTTVKFETAWSHPWPIIKALSRKFPHKGIMVCYADEDLGHNCDAYSIQDGEIVQAASFPSGSDEANELAAQVLYGTTYAEVKARWDEDTINSARSYLHSKRIEKERGVDNGYAIIREEKLDLPKDIIDQIQTVEDAEAIW